ncbi:glycosyltransferase family 2 protein (plasmid) [Clostridium perfringens]
MSELKISLVMIVKDESSTIKNCILSAKKLVDEIIVVDTGSKDDTKVIASKCGAKIYDFVWNDNFADARNFALSKSTGDWNLILDADEVVTKGSRKDLIDFANKNHNYIGRICITSKFIYDGEVSYSSEYISRLAPRDALYSGSIHEQLDLGFPRKDTPIEVAHSGYFETDKSKRNLKLLLSALNSKPNDNYLIYQTAKTLSNAKQYDEADKYFKKAYKYLKHSLPYEKDLIISYLYNIIHLYNIDYGLKIIEKYKNKFADDVDFNFVCGIYYMNLIISKTNIYADRIHLIEKHYLKCLELGECKKNSVLGVGSFKASYNLAAYYEVLGDLDKAIKYYSDSAKQNFNPAKKRLNSLIKN